MSKHLLLLPVLAAALAMARDQPGNWIEVSSPRFTVVTNSSEKQARRIVAQFERMRAILEDAYPELESDAESPVVVLAVKDKRAFRELEPGTYLAKGSLRLHGMFLRASDKKYILMRLDAEGGNPYPLVYHEYTHVLLSEAGEWMPLWLNEGLAQFFENTEIYDEDVLLGEPSQKHLMLLRQEELLPLATLITVDERSPYYLEAKKGSVFYAESWALVHYLTLKDYEGRTSKLREYAKLVSEKVDPVTAAIRVFGDLKKLQRALEQYIEQRSFNHFETKNLARVDSSQFELQSITAIEAEAVKADFLACNGRLDEARGLLQHVLQQDPDNISAKETMVSLESSVENQTENELRGALQVAASSAMAYDRLATFLWKRGKNLDEAQSLESRAVSLDGRNLGYRINHANILLGMGRAQAALEVLQGAASLTKDPNEAEVVNELLTDARKYVSEQELQRNETREQAGPAPAASPSAVHEDHGFVPSGPHRFLVGVLKGVHCEPPNLDLTVSSRAKTLTLHAENYFKIQFTALFTPSSELKPCDDLENRPAKVEYVESADGSEIPHLIGVELRK
jgi:tetratricopeptide (TPR) repeat protein